MHVWESVDDIEEHLVPVHESDDENRWLTMPKINPGGNPNRVVDELAEEGWRCRDMKPANVGIVGGEDGKIMTLDYDSRCLKTRPYLRLFLPSSQKHHYPLLYVLEKT